MANKTTSKVSEGLLADLPSLSERPLISVVVPALNEARHILRCLESVEGQTYPHELIEVIVADGGSSDRTREIVAEFGVRSTLNSVRLVDNPQRTTPTGLNAGVAAASGDVIVNLIAHVAADAEYLEANVRALRGSGAAAAGGPVATEPGSATAEGRAIAAALSHRMSVGDARHRFGNEPGPAETLYYAAYRRECFERIGGFDPNRVRAEDDTYNLRIRQAGGLLWFSPDIRTTYYARATYRALAKQYFGFGRAKGRVQFLEEGALSARHWAPLGALTAAGVVAVLAPVSGLARLMGTAGTVVYVGAAAIAGADAGGRGLALRVAAAFPVVHASYGAGMAVGLVEGWRAKRRNS